MMLDREVAQRADKRFANRLRNAKMRFPNACIEDIRFTATRGLDRRQILSLGQGGWLKPHEQIILTGQTGTGQTGTGQTGTGQTGTGKTWLACAFAHQAARMDYSVAYARVPRLFEDLATAPLDGRFPKLIDKLARVQLLVLDDWGTHSLTDQQRLDLLELFEERYQRRSTIITAQPPVSGWHQMIGEPTIADAILDRIIHNAHRVELKGDSMRRKSKVQGLTQAENQGLTQAENSETITAE
jgi:DNA replication protein DnaC